MPKHKPSKQKRPKVGPYATAEWDDVRGDWEVRLTVEGQQFILDRFAVHGCGIGLLRHLFKKIYNTARELGLPDEEIEAECRVASIEALQFWKPEIASYQTYLGWKLRRQMQRVIRQNNAEFRAGVTLVHDFRYESTDEPAMVIDNLDSNPLRLDNRTVEERYEDAETREQIRQMVLSSLPVKRDREILIRRFGLHGKGPETLEQVGKAVGVTRERVRQIEQRSLTRIRAYLRRTKSQLLEPMEATK